MNRTEPYIGMPVVFDQRDTCPEARTSKAQNPQTEPQNMQPMSLAMAYVPWQKWTETYPLEKGFAKGTIFPDLDFPFEKNRMGGLCK